MGDIYSTFSVYYWPYTWWVCVFNNGTVMMTDQQSHLKGLIHHPETNIPNLPYVLIAGETEYSTRLI